MSRLPRRYNYVRPLLVVMFLFIIMALPGGQRSVWNAVRPTASAAVTFTVNSVGDAADINPGDGICNDGSACTLRAAIQEANAASGTDTVNFNLPANSVITLNTQLPSFSGNISIVGPGSSLLTIQRSSAAGTPIFQIFSFTPINGNFNDSVSGLTLLNGNATGTFTSNMSGGGIFNFEACVLTLTDVVISGSTSTNGGGLYNEGTATLTNCKVTGNSSPNGGGILNRGTMTIINSTVSGNTSDGQGAGIVNNLSSFNASGGLTLTNSTVSGNSALNGGVGAIANLAGSSNILTLSNTTVTANTASGSGSGVGGIFNGTGSTANIKNSIIAQNTSALMLHDLNGTFNSQGYNLIGESNGGTGFTNGTNGDQVGTTASPLDPKLGVLADNGGPTKTHALLIGSPAIDAGNSVLTTDQRGQPRPVDDQTVVNAGGGNSSDIGSYEAHLLEVNTTADADDGLCRPLGTGNGCTLREAINAANAGPGAESIVFAPALTSGGSVTITLLTALPDLASDMSISGPGASLMAVRRSSAGGTPDFRIFTVNSGITVSLSGLTISNGQVTGTNPNVPGGGISNSGNLTVGDCTVSGNSASGGGGGINNSGTLTVNNCTVSGNTGGGISNSLFGGAPTATINNSVISGNTVGGGIYNNALNATTTLSINGCTISGNSSTGLGGGLQNTSGSFTSRANATISNSTFSGNTAASGGGGIANGAFFGSAASTLSITNSTISGNTATSSGGGGIYHFTNGSGSTATLTITNATIAKNDGGGIAIVDPPSTTNTVRLRSTIVAGNTYSGSRSDISGNVSSASSSNLIGDGTNMVGMTNGTNGNQIGSAISPFDPLLGPLANNGGPTATHALLPGSPAIDAADNCVLNNSCSPTLAAALTTDQRGAGFNRAMDGNGDGAATVDIGAYEVQTILVTTLADSGVGSLRQAIIDANATPAAEIISFQPGLTGVISLASALPDLTGFVSIIGPGANLLTVQRSAAGGTPDFRVFTIAPAANVSVARLTISNGRLASGNTGQDDGAGFYNNGTLTIRDCDVTNNLGDSGSAIYNKFGSLTIVNSNVINNSSIGGLGTILTTGASASFSFVNSTLANNTIAGGIFIGSGTNTISNSTISNNVTQGAGGGIYSSGGPATTLLITDTTITGNRAGVPNSGGVGGGLLSTAGVVTLRNTIVAGNFRTASPIADDIYGTVDAASSFNLIGTGGAGGLSNGVNNNQVGVADARLAPLANNGGRSLTHALLAGSPALDAGSNANLPTDIFDVDDDNDSAEAIPFDVRGQGFSRVVDGPDVDAIETVDVGSFEAQISLPKFADQTINEDGSLSLPCTLGGAASITNLTVVSSNTTLVPNNPASISVSGSGSTRTLQITPVANLFGSSTITLTISGNNSQTMTDTFVLTVNSVNDAPSFTKGGDQTVNENSGAQTVDNWATNLSTGPANESGQTLTFVIINNSNPSLFAAGPAVSPAGKLTYTPATGASGVASIEVALMDNGGIANGGIDTSAGQTFNINVLEGGTLSFSAATYSIAEDGGSASITVTRSGGSAGIATVQFATSNGTATTADYTSVSQTITFNDGEVSKTVSIAITDDLLHEPDETVNLTLSNAGGSGQLGAQATAVLTILDNDPAGGYIRFSSANFNTTESSGSTTITVQRFGDTTQAASVNYATAEDVTVVPCGTVNGIASSRCDFTSALGTLRFAAGETTKTFAVLITQDNYVEGPESLTIILSSPAGGAVLTTPSTATLTIADDASEPAGNPIDIADVFVRQHYHDFLNREPDPPGIAYWSNQITQCEQPGAICDPGAQRVNVSAAFFLSIEFQETGFLVERIYKTAYGDADALSALDTYPNTHPIKAPIVKFIEFLPDTQQISKDVMVGVGNWQMQLENNKVAFTQDFVTRSRFIAAFPTTMTPAEFVDKLFANAGVTPTAGERGALIDDFAGNGADVGSRARALRRVAENATLAQAETNKAFVLMQYFGYLRRDPNAAPDTDHTGYDFWLHKLNQFNGNYINAEMVRAFISSIEYRERFAP